MPYKRLFIWVEGPDDLRFFERIVSPALAPRYDWIDIVNYAEMADEKIRGFITSIKAIPADYIFVADRNDRPCVTECKTSLRGRIPTLDNGRIAVVITEIEGWYLAGLTASRARGLGIPAYGDTDDISKEQFNAMIPAKWDSRVDFMLEVLKKVSIREARNRNRSFRYFTDRYLIPWPRLPYARWPWRGVRP